jgi:hypothetical protein
MSYRTQKSEQGPLALDSTVREKNSVNQPAPSGV